MGKDSVCDPFGPAAAPFSSLITLGRVPMANMLQEQSHAILKPLLQQRSYKLSSSCSAMHDYASNSYSQVSVGCASFRCYLGDVSTVSAGSLVDSPSCQFYGGTKVCIVS